MNKELTRKRSKYHSHKIDKFLIQEYEHRKKEIQLLLIGLPNSGKNTFCKQMRLHFGDGFPVTYRTEMKPTILANMTDAIAMVLEYMKETNITFSDILAHRLQEYLVNSRSENGWITKDFIIYDENYKTSNHNHTGHHLFKRQESTLKPKLNNITDQLNAPGYFNRHSPHIDNNNNNHNIDDQNTSNNKNNNYLKTSFSASNRTMYNSPPSIEPIQSSGAKFPLYNIDNLTNEPCLNTTTTTMTTSTSTTTTDNNTHNPTNTESLTDSIVEKFLSYVHENNSIPPSVLKKFESIIGRKSMDNWQTLIEDKQLLHDLIHYLLQTGIDNWSSFLMYQSIVPPPIPTTLPPISVEDELLNYIVTTSDSCDTSDETDDDEDGDDDDEDDIVNGLTGSSNSSLTKTLVKGISGNVDTDDDDDEDDEVDGNDCIDLLKDVNASDDLTKKPVRKKLSVAATKRKNKGIVDNHQLDNCTQTAQRNYVELNSNFNFLEFSIDQLNEMNYFEHKISLNSLQIIMKIITDQMEFRRAFLEYLPILTQRNYAGS
ncbi:unnamed protein product [Schistosoma turkestanicum]|nr:unnamed protein product [Schistosoma turkestanicum]